MFTNSKIGGGGLLNNKALKIVHNKQGGVYYV